MLIFNNAQLQSCVNFAEQLEQICNFDNDNSNIQQNRATGIKYEKLYWRTVLHTRVKCDKYLKIFCANLIHVTCLAHAWSLVAEVIRNQCEDVNDLISNVEKVFLEAYFRIHAFREALPDYPLPPEPVLKRWGSRIEATIYYWEHFDDIKRFVYCYS